MFKNNALQLLLLFVLTSLSLNSIAQGKNFSISRNEPHWIRNVTTVDKKPANKDVQDGYYIFLFEKQNNLETNEYYQHMIRDISSGSGVQNGSEISISYDPSYEKLVFHKLIIWRNKKPLDKLNAQKFKIIQKEKELSRFIYSGLYTAYLILDDIRKGDRIEYSYTTKGNNPAFTKYSNTIYFEGGSQIVNVYHNIIFNSKRHIKTKNFNDTPKLKKTVENGLNIFEWQGEMTKTYPDHDNEPSYYNPYGRVQLSEYNSWSEIVDWGLKLKNYDLKNSKVINDKIAELKIKSKNDKKKYLTLATRFVQDEIRYMGIEIGEYSHRPNTPEKILQQRYGDCKDKSTLLTYLLNANGIKAYSVFINTYLEKETAALLPSPTVFNHEVVMVEIDDRNIYIDPTISDQRGPITSINFPYDANVLVIKPGTDALKLTPSRLLGKTKSRTTFKIGDTAKNEITTLKVITTYSNNYADDYRANLNEDGVDSYEKTYLDYYVGIYPGLTLKKPLQVDDDEEDNVITVTEDYEIKNFWTKDDSNKKKLSAYFYGDLIEDELVSLKKYRDAPLSIIYPSNIDQEITVILPFASNVERENVKIDNENYRFLFSANSKMDTLHLSYYFQNFKPVLETNSLEQYILDKKEIKNAVAYGIYYGGNSTTAYAGINYWLITLTTFSFLLFCGLASIFYFKKQPFNLGAIKNAQQIGGWLIVIAIGISIAPISLLITMGKSGLYNQTNWDNLDNFDRFATFGYKFAYIFESIANAILLSFSFLIIFSFFNRRKSLPYYFIAFKISSFIILLLDISLTFWIQGGTTANYNYISDITRLVLQGIFATIWILYFIKSERVKATFVFTYPKSLWITALRQDLSKNFQTNHIPNNTPNFEAYNTIEENERL
jgi:transglutaminase-like putative cysteine protease